MVEVGCTEFVLLTPVLEVAVAVGLLSFYKGRTAALDSLAAPRGGGVHLCHHQNAKWR